MAAMDLGILSFNTEFTTPAHELARACEERGFESVWLPEHTNIPVRPLAEYPDYPGGTGLPEGYLHINDPFVGLAAAAVVTSTIKLGTGISLVNQHDPIVQAKQVATLDRLSGGRFLFGVGAGWNRAEMANHGVPPGRRWDVLAEHLAAMKALWTQEEAAYEGEFVRFEATWSYPKPLTRPHPPILLGSTTKQVARLVVEHCDGWIPVGALVDDLAAAIADLHGHAERAGRDPATIPVSIFCVDLPDLDRLGRYQDLGVARTVIAVPDREPGDDDAARAVLDRYAELIPKLN